jgi:hypothetical protein
VSIKNKKSSLIIVSILVVIATTGIAFAVYKSNDSETVATTDPLDTINYGEATETEKQETAANKDKVAAQTESQNNQQSSETPGSQSSKKTVTPILTYIEQQDSGSVAARGYIPGIIENGGTCTLTLSKGSIKLADNHTAYGNAQNTGCGLMIIDKSKLSSGTWSATISYISVKYTGTSEPQNVRVN